MAKFNSLQIENFFKKSERFFNSHYPVLEDKNGMPTKVLTEKNKYSLIHAVDRHRLAHSITQDLIKVMCFESEEAAELALYYVNLKYTQYKDYIMSL